MTDQSIDRRCQVNLPNSDTKLFVQLVEGPPEWVDYRINLKNPQQNKIHVVPTAVYASSALHDSGRAANALRGYQLFSAGMLGVAVANSWDLESQVVVANNRVELSQNPSRKNKATPSP